MAEQDSNKNNTWMAYLATIAPYTADNAIAKKTGVQQSMMSKWRHGQASPGLKMVTAVATAYGRNPVEAYVAAGLIDLDLVIKSLRMDSILLLRELGFNC